MQKSPLCPEYIIDDLTTQAEKQFNMPSGRFSFLKNTIFRALLYERSNGDSAIMRLLLLRAIETYCSRPIAELENSTLFLGAEVNALDETTIAHKGITHILNVAGEYSAEFLDDIIYKNATLDDTESQQLPIEECVSFIEESIENGGKVMVHCAEGVSRSAAVVIAYLMKKHHWDYENAYMHITKQRFICPNSGFVEQLKEYYRSIK